MCLDAIKGTKRFLIVLFLAGSMDPEATEAQSLVMRAACIDWVGSNSAE
jgi:hypothetical protein